MSVDPSSVTRRVGAAVAAASILAALNACGSDEESDDTTTPEGSTAATTAGAATAEFRNLGDDDSIQTKEYVGAIPGTEVYAAFAISRSKDDAALAGAQAYFCDGTTVSKWFSPKAGSNIEFVAADGSTFTVEEKDGTVTGTVTLDGTTHDISAAEVDPNGEAGLYLADHVIDPDLATDERGGWIVLPDGTQRGAIRGGSTILPGPSLTVNTGQVTVNGRNILLRAISEIIGLDKKT